MTTIRTSFAMSAGFPRIQTSVAALAVAATAFCATYVSPMSMTVAEARDGQIKVRSTASGSQRMKLGLNKSVVIDLPSDAYDILVANPAVADAVTRTARRIYLLGTSLSETNIYVFGPTGE